MMNYFIGIGMAVLFSGAAASTSYGDEGNPYPYTDTVLETTHFLIDKETVIPLMKYIRTNDAGEHVTCQQYVKFNHAMTPATQGKDFFKVYEFCR